MLAGLRLFFLKGVCPFALHVILPAGARLWPCTSAVSKTFSTNAKHKKKPSWEQHFRCGKLKEMVGEQDRQQAFAFAFFGDMRVRLQVVLCQRPFSLHSFESLLCLNLSLPLLVKSMPLLSSLVLFCVASCMAHLSCLVRPFSLVAEFSPHHRSYH